MSISSDREDGRVREKENYYRICERKGEQPSEWENKKLWCLRREAVLMTQMINFLLTSEKNSIFRN